MSICDVILYYLSIGLIFGTIWQFAPKDVTGSNWTRAGFGLLLLFFWLPLFLFAFYKTIKGE
jgi:hypothetical protein